MTATIELLVNGKRISAPTGVTVAAVLLNAGESVFRRSVIGEARGPVCGMGICFECRVAIDGIPHQRACMRAAVDGMRVDTLDRE